MVDGDGTLPITMLGIGEAGCDRLLNTLYHPAGLLLNVTPRPALGVSERCYCILNCCLN
jgi:hypothetical protein